MIDFLIMYWYIFAVAAGVLVYFMFFKKSKCCDSVPTEKEKKAKKEKEKKAKKAKK